MSFPSGNFTNDDIEKIERDSDDPKKVIEDLQSAERKTRESPNGDSSSKNEDTVTSEKDNNKDNESPNADSSSKNEEPVTSEKDNNKDNEIKEDSFPYEWLVEYNYPETLHNLIVSLDIKKDQFLSLQIEDLKDYHEVYKKIKAMQKEKYDEWEKISRDEMLRTHALETLVDGYSELSEEFDVIRLKTESQLKTLEDIDKVMSKWLEEGKEWFKEGKKELGIKSGTALELVAGAMENQIQEFRKTFNEENKARKEFFKNEYTQLKEGLDKAIKDSNIKNAINKTTIILFIAMIFTQMLTLGLLGYIYKM